MWAGWLAGLSWCRGAQMGLAGSGGKLQKKPQQSEIDIQSGRQFFGGWVSILGFDILEPGSTPGSAQGPRLRGSLFSSQPRFYSL